MAISLEEVEKLREKTGASYEVCKGALERAGGDMLDAVIYLEKVGQSKGGGTAYTYTTRPSGTTAEDVRRAFTQPTGGHKSKRGAEPNFDWNRWLREVGEMGLNLLRHSTVNQLEVWRYDRLMTSVPVLILALLIVLAFWISIPLLIFGLFIGCRYRFVGPDLGKEKINDVMDNVSATVDDMMGQVKREFHESKEKGKKAEDTAAEVERKVDDVTSKMDDFASKLEKEVDGLSDHIDSAFSDKNK